MAESPPHLPPTNSPKSSIASASHVPIEIEIVPDEEMALIEAAMAEATRSAIRLTQSSRNIRSINSISLLSKRRISWNGKSESVGDIEDLARAESSQKRRNTTAKSFSNRFGRKRVLRVTDLSGTEWCEKRMELTLKYGRHKPSEAMRAGSSRHSALEDEINKKVKVQAMSSEDVWALKFLNFIICSNQLLVDGLTREIPLVSFERGVWMVGAIDEIQMTLKDAERYPMLIDTKTRVQARLPSESQRRNSRFQLMCYKLIWDNLVADKFPVERFYNSFSLNRYQTLSVDVRKNAARSGIHAETLDELVRCFRNTSSKLTPAHDQLLLRYEWQEDQSLIGEDQFAYDSEWLDNTLKSCLEFWHGERDPSYPPMEDRWKCNYCKFNSVCPANAGLESSLKEEISSRHSGDASP